MAKTKEATKGKAHNRCTDTFTPTELDVNRGEGTHPRIASPRDEPPSSSAPPYRINVLAVYGRFAVRSQPVQGRRMFMPHCASHSAVLLLAAACSLHGGRNRALARVGMVTFPGKAGIATRVSPSEISLAIPEHCHIRGAYPGWHTAHAEGSAGECGRSPSGQRHSSSRIVQSSSAHCQCRGH